MNTGHQRTDRLGGRHTDGGGGATEATEDLAEAGEGAAVAVPAGVVELAGLVATGLPNLAVGLEFPLTDDGLVFAIR